MIVDVSACVGEYPFRFLDARREPAWLLTQMDRLAIDRAWVGHLPSILYKDPAAGTAELLRAVQPHADRLVPVPTIHPGLPGWEDDLNVASLAGAPAIRVYPMQQGLDPAGSAMRVIVAAAGAIDMPVMLTVRMEDLRQRHPLDAATDMPASAIRALARSDVQARLIVLNADRPMLEEVHFGLTDEEARRVLWDIGWLWGPPEDHLRLLIETVGIGRFTFGTGMPLRIPDGAFAKVDLLDLTDADRAAITGGNLSRWRAG
ncbi:MAG TPA: hypothetical protein VGA37_02585 [Gemmatimonadales bacterium]